MYKKSVSGYKLIFGYLGLFMMLIGIIILLPLLVIIFFPEELENAKYFIIPGVLSIVLGYFTHFFILGKSQEKLEKYQDAVLILLIWIVAIFISSVPFLLTGNYNFTQSIFETTSGYSTTGLSVVDVSTTPKIFLMYRSLLQFIGGVGLVLILTSALSDRYGMRLYSAEGHNDKLLPNLARSARLILSIYFVYIIVGSLLYVLFGMSFFDAINHSIAAVSTGGFSTKVNSIAYFKSLPIEIVTIILMLLGNTNFVVHLFLIKGRLKNAIKHIELKFLLILSVIFLPLMILSIVSNFSGSLGEAIRIGLFQFVSGITTTGFQSVDSLLILPNFTLVCVIILMIIGGGIGSTAGGIKQYRVVLAIKNLYWNFRDRISHKNMIRSNYINKFGKVKEVSSQEIVNNNSHIFVYLSTLLIGTLVFTAYGYSLQESLFEFSSALGTVGLSIGLISFNSPPLILWTANVGMFMGRLEFYVVFVAIAKIFMDMPKRKIL
jgi:trk system potassium uptake protein TrkH